MTEDTTVEAQEATPQGSQPAAPTAEQVEAEYKARLSGKDKAHAAEVATLRAQIEALSGEKAQATSQAEGTLSEVDALKKQLADAQRASQQREQEYAVTIRSAKYPYAAEALDPQVLAQMDEAKLAGLNARLAPTKPGAGIDPSTPARTTSGAKPTDQKTAAELKADLQRFGPAFAAEIAADQ